MMPSVLTGANVMTGFLIFTLVFSFIGAMSNMVYSLLSLFIDPKKVKPDFDAIDCRNETRYLRYHYPEDKG